MIFSVRLLAYCLVCGAIYLIVVDLVWSRLERLVPTLKNFPENLVEPKNPSWFVYNFVVEFIFFVLVPSVVFDWFFTIMPFSGIRGGVALGLFLFLFGMIPFAILHLFRIRVPAVHVLYQLLGLLIKIAGAWAIIGYLYSL